MTRLDDEHSTVGGPEGYEGEGGVGRDSEEWGRAEHRAKVRHGRARQVQHPGLTVRGLPLGPREWRQRSGRLRGLRFTAEQHRGDVKGI